MRGVAIGYARPVELSEALRLVAQGAWLPLAGGTNVYPAHVDRLIEEPVLNLTAVGELLGVARSEHGWRIGATTTWTDILKADLPPAFDALKLAAREVGSVQIQNRGTVAGNLCNASPAADGVPPLLALDAEVELARTSGSRRLPLGEFILGNRRTALRAGELLTAIHVPARAGQGRSHFLKLGARKYLVISIAMVAARVVVGANDRIANAAIAVGSCSAVAQRLPAAEAALVDAPGVAASASRIVSGHLAPLAPIDDVRATAAYRLEAALECVRRAVAACLAPS